MRDSDISFNPNDQQNLTVTEQPIPAAVLSTPAYAAGLEALTQILAVAGRSATALAQFVGDSPAIAEIKRRITLLSHTDDTVLITGPSGHGKELLARALHKNTVAPFIAVNCAALPESLIASLLFGHVKGTFTGANDDRPGYFEAADKGTVFLDEIGDMPESLQPYLLRVIQERTITRLGEFRERSIKCRIIAATNKVTDIRPDLLGRLSTFRIDIPPLAERPDDIKSIAAHYGIPAEQSQHLLTSTHLQHISIYGVRHIQACGRRFAVFGTID